MGKDSNSLRIFLIKKSLRVRGRVVELIVTLCHDGKFDRVTRGREFVSALG